MRGQRPLLGNALAIGGQYKLPGGTLCAQLLCPGGTNTHARHDRAAERGLCERRGSQRITARCQIGAAATDAAGATARVARGAGNADASGAIAAAAAGEMLQSPIACGMSRRMVGRWSGRGRWIGGTRRR